MEVKTEPIYLVSIRYILYGEMPFLSGFLTEPSNPADGSIHLSPTPFFTGNVVTSYRHDEVVVHRLPDGAWLYESPAGMPPAQVLSEASGTKLQIYLPPWKDAAQQQMKLMHLLRTALECCFCARRIVSLHAACVEKDGFAVAFTGESGLGKSTRAKAWVEALDAQWISGDRPAVRLLENSAIACGAPWDGKEQICRNVQRPLLAVLDVRRSSRTYLRRLSPAQARRLLMRQCFLPMWDTDAAAMAMENVRQLPWLVPVYRLFCGPDAQAARLSYDILFHHPENILEEAEEMKIKEGFVLRNVVGESIVMPTGDNIAKFDGAVVLNEVSAFVFEKLQHPVCRADLLAAVLDEFEVDADTAAKDLDALLRKLSTLDMLDAE